MSGQVGPLEVLAQVRAVAELVKKLEAVVALEPMGTVTAALAVVSLHANMEMSRLCGHVQKCQGARNCQSPVSTMHEETRRFMCEHHARQFSDEREGL